MNKPCFKCKISQPLENFYKHPDMPDGRVNKCKECNKQDVRKNYADNIEVRKAYDSYRHKHSIPRLFGHKYSMIKTRCTKVRSSNGKPYKVYGTKFLSKKDWLHWCYEGKNYAVFVDIYNKWVQSNYEHKLTPSIDRIKSNLGYVRNNLQWLTLSENCKKYNK